MGAYAMTSRDIAEGLPRISAEQFDRMYDVPVSGRRFSRSIHFQLDSDDYQAVQDLSHHPGLPFHGSLSALMRHYTGSGNRSLRESLRPERRGQWEVYEEAALHWTNERHITTIHEQIDVGVDVLSVWTMAREWVAVANNISFVAENIRSYPNPVWRTFAARGWTQHTGVRRLLHQWEEQMRTDAAEQWSRVLAAYEDLVVLSRAE